MFDFGGDLYAHVDFNSRSIAVEKSGGPRSELRNHFILNHIAPRVLAHEGSFLGHGSAVEFEEGLLVFLGDSGRGKSTLATSFHDNGHAIQSDDAIVFSFEDGILQGQGTYRSLRLRSDSYTRFFGNLDSGCAELADGKRDVSGFLHGSDRRSAKPVRAIFVFSQPGDFIRIRKLQKAEYCMALVANSFALDPSSANFAARRMKMASEVATSVPGFELSRGNNLDDLEKLRDRVVQTVRNLN